MHRHNAPTNCTNTEVEGAATAAESATDRGDTATFEEARKCKVHRFNVCPSRKIRNSCKLDLANPGKEKKRKAMQAAKHSLHHSTTLHIFKSPVYWKVISFSFS
jgi:hypothetical protein